MGFLGLLEPRVDAGKGSAVEPREHGAGPGSWQLWPLTVFVVLVAVSFGAFAVPAASSRLRSGVS
jgi:hypothetical protein